MIRLFRVSMPTSVLALVVSETALLFACYIAAAGWAVNDGLSFFLLYEGGLLQIGIVVAVIQVGLYLQDLYDNVHPKSRLLLAQQVSLILGIAFLAQALLGYGRSTMQLPKWTMLIGSLIVLLVLPLWRLAFYSLVSKALPGERLLLLGASPALREIAQRLIERPELGLSVIGYLNSAPADLPNALLLGDMDALDEAMRTCQPDRIVVGLTEGRGRLPVQRLLELRFSGIHIEEAATLFEAVFGRLSIRDLRPSLLIFSTELGPRPWSVALHNIYSMAFGILGIVVSLPVMAVVALLVKFSSPGPILLRQTRVGLRGAPFTLYKFRSMYADAEARTGAVWATKNDPRITPIGRWLRRLRLDELPQFFNVIRGEMSIVGPRPERPEFSAMLEEKIPFYKQRHWVKPGITGWAQINHKYGDTLEDTRIKLEYDLYYIKNLAPALDAYIIFQTLKVVLLARGGQ